MGVTKTGSMPNLRKYQLAHEQYPLLCSEDEQLIRWYLKHLEPKGVKFLRFVKAAKSIGSDSLRFGEAGSVKRVSDLDCCA